MKIDEDKIEGKLSELRGYVQILESMKNVSLEELRKDPIRYGGIRYYLQISAECCVDIGTHLISRLKLKRYEEYKEVFTILGDAGIIPKDFVPTLHKMVGFRNILVHLYWRVEIEKVYEILQNNLDDFGKFASCIARYLKVHKEKNR